MAGQLLQTNNTCLIQDRSKWSTAAPRHGIWFYIQIHIIDVAIGQRMATSMDLHGCVLTASTAVFIWTSECAGAGVCRL